MPANYILLETIDLTQSAASVIFDNLPSSGYTDLKIVMSGRGNGTSFGTQPWQNCSITLNSTSSTSAKQLYGTAAGTGSDTQGSGIWITDPESTSNTFSNNEIYLPNYLSSNAKSISVDNVTENNGADSALVFWTASFSTVTNPVTSISITPVSGSFLLQSTFSLYGIAATGTTPTVGPKATGGNIVANDGTYWYHAFLNSGKFIPASSLSCNVLAVGGGGGGGGLGSGGGGGGVIPSSSLSFTSTNIYQINVGSGGSGVAAQDLSTSGGRGTDTTVSHSAGTITAYGGGGGLAYAPSSDLSSKNGGSGGGGGGSSNQYGPGTGVSGQGFAGGNSMNDSSIRGGGGGGYSGVGANASSGAGGNGAQGYNLPIAIQNILLGMTYVGSGGGGSCRQSTGSAGTGGTGASNGNNNAANVSPPTMFGCGGGSSGQTGPSQPWGATSAGYSGVVVIRYAMA